MVGAFCSVKLIALSCIVIVTLAREQTHHSIGTNDRSRLPQTSVRLPPGMTLNFDLNSTWEGPPSGWLYGNWKVAWSSNPSFQPFWNPEMDYSPRVPVSEDGRQINNDLCTWNTACKDESETYSIFVYDTEREPGSFVFDWRGNGALSEERSTWELMAWGHDTANIGYILIYEHGSPQVETDSGFAAVHIEAREWGHPTAATKAELLEAVKAFEDQKLTKLANEVMELKHDDRRVGALPFACYDECMNNTNTAEHWKRTVEKAVECPRWTHDEL